MGITFNGTFSSPEPSLRIKPRLMSQAELDHTARGLPVTSINTVDADSLIAELVSLSMAYYTKLNAEGKATPAKYASWMTRAAKRGV